jgi:hypothetical protein
MPEGLVMREDVAMVRTARRPGESQHRKRRSSQAHSAPFKQINLNAAGIDVGAGSILKVEMTGKTRGFTALKTEACGLTQAAYLHF